MSKPTASQSAALTVQAPDLPLCAATTTTAETFDLRAWCGLLSDPVTACGRYIDVTAEGDGHYVLFSAATGATVTPATESKDAAVPASSAEVPTYIADGTTRSWMVDPAKPFLNVRAKTGTGFVRVARS